MAVSSMMAAGSSGRITGLASGLDVDQVIEGMLAGEKAKIDKLYQEKQYVGLKQEAYRDIIKGFKEFQKYFDSTSDKFLSTNDFNTSKLTLSSEKYFSATSSSSVMSGDYKVTVNQLASKTTIEGKSIGGVYELDGSDKVIEVKDKDGVVLGNIKKNADNTVDITGFEDKINVKTYEKDGKTYVKFQNISSDTLKLDDKEIIDLSKDTKLTQLGIKKDSTANFTIDGKNFSFEVTEETTVSNLKDKIKEESGNKVTIEIDEELNRINFVSTTTGKNTDFTVISDIDTELGSNPGGKIIGKDAQAEITRPDGLKTTINSSSNNISEFGLQLELKQADSAKEIEINVDKTGSIDNTVDKVKEFIKDYNAIVGTVYNQMTAKKNYSYKPLTEAQKESMSDDEIKKWNEKVKTGILSGDSMLENMFSDLRNVFSTNIQGTDARFGKYGAGSIGLDGFTTFSKSGQIDIDESKLKETLKESPNLVEEFFKKLSDKEIDETKSYVGSDKFKEDGVINRINTILKEYVGMPGIGEDGKSTLKGALNILVNKQYDYSMTGSSSKNTMPDQVYRKQLALDKLKEKMFDKQDQLYRQFSRLETAMNSLNSQSNYLMSQFGGM